MTRGEKTVISDTNNYSAFALHHPGHSSASKASVTLLVGIFEADFEPDYPSCNISGSDDVIKCRSAH